MADEKVTAESTPQEKETVTNVTDEALSSAYDATQTEQTEVTEQTETTETEETQEETQEQKTQEEIIPDEPADNAERSRLGRRMKSIEEQNKQLLEEIKSLRGEKPLKQETAVPENVTYNDSFIQSQLDIAVEKGIIPSTIITPQDQVKVNNFINKLQSDIGNQYANKYLGTLNSPSLKGQTPDDIHAEVVAELQKYESPFNQRRYDNPLLDAKMNYLEAKESILMKRLSSGKPENKFKGKPKDSPATGTSISTRTLATATDLPELDAYSKDFIAKTGMSEESVRAALKEPMPIHLRGR
ncbi:MAG: hypothetical protein WC332_02380 [Clostridia bacterium]|jgi:hypothetical protein